MSITIPIPNVVRKICNIVSAEASKEVRIVGGYVRTILMQELLQLDVVQPTADIDIATDMLPEELMHTLAKYSIKTIPTGIKHGTIMVPCDGYNLEVTTLRQDVKCDGRHAIVSYGHDWKQDAARRDFTINAMYADVYGKLYDYFDGKNDIKNKIVRFIGDPVARIHEDYLRIIRYFRFLGYFGSQDINTLNLHTKSLEACVELAPNITKLSSERIRDELMKILSSSHPYVSIAMLVKHCIFEYIAINMQLKFDDIKLEQIFFIDDPIINLSAVLTVANIQSEQLLVFLKRLRFSNNDRRRIMAICFPNVTKDKIQSDLKMIINALNRGSNSKIKNAIHHSIQVIGLEKYLDQLKVTFVLEAYNFSSLHVNHHTIPNMIVTYVDSIEVKKLPVRGGDIMAMGYSGKQVAEKLSLARKIWLDNNCNMNRDEIISLLQRYR